MCICRCKFLVPLHLPSNATLETDSDRDVNSAASAIAANSIVRSLAGAGFPMFGTIMVSGNIITPDDLPGFF